jgi:hypothetical protein
LFLINFHCFNPLCLTAVTAFGRVVDSPGENAGKNIGRMAAELCAFLAEMRSDVERAILGHTPTAIAVFGFEVMTDNEFSGAHAIPILW